MYSIGIIKHVPKPACGFEFGIKYDGEYITNRDVLILMKMRPDVWHALFQRAIIKTENSGNFFEMPNLTGKTINDTFRTILMVYPTEHSTRVLCSVEINLMGREPFQSYQHWIFYGPFGP